MSGRRRLHEVQPEALNMTPMIDVVFQLLIFFMLTMQFREVEGKLLSQLPRDRGLDPSTAPLLVEEIRIAVSASEGGALGRVRVEGHDVGELARTETRPARLAPNRAVYRAAADRSRELLEGAVSRRVILDAAPEVPYEHVVGLIDALKAVRVDAVEFVGHPRYLPKR